MKNNFLKKFGFSTRFLFGLPLLFVNPIKAETEKTLLAEAIKSYSSISPQEDIKLRLFKKEAAINKVDEILDMYADTDTGLTLLSTGKFGKFDIEKIRKEYLDELVTFNLKTCESSPSFSCFGFISLNNGIEACDKPTQFSHFLKASNNFKNAYSIFKSQGDGKKYGSGVLSAYRNCSKKAPSNFSRDFINSQLISVLLSNKDETKAVGITQNMKTPLFKLLSAADVRISQGKYDYKTFNKILSRAQQLGDVTDRTSAIYELTNKLYETGLDPFSNDAQRQNVRVVLPGMGVLTQKCNAQRDYLSERAMDLIFHAMTQPGVQIVGGSPMNMLRANSQNYYNASLVANSCSGSNYELGPITYFLEKDPRIASKIRQFQSERGNNNQINVDFFVSNIPNEKLLGYIKAKDQSRQNQSGVQSQINDNMAMMDGMMNANPMMRSFVGGPMQKQRKKAERESLEKSIFPFGSKYGQFNLFKLYVDASNVCDASKSFFSEVRGSKYESDSVNYFISSPNIIVDKKYECGDADLDLLIN